LISLSDPLGDHRVALVEVEGAEEPDASPMADLAELGDVVVVDGHGERERVEPGAVARVARHLAHVALVLLARPVALGLGGGA
jgi:hypothetical protein